MQKSRTREERLLQIFSRIFNYIGDMQGKTETDSRNLIRFCIF